MVVDFWIVLQWWGTLFLVGAVAYPLTKLLFGLDPRLRGDDRKGWWDGGYLFSKAVGMATVTWIVFVMGSMRVMPFSVGSIALAMGSVFFIGIMIHRGNKGEKADTGNWGRILIEEVMFLAALLFWSWVKGHEPSIRGLEKFMDYGFMQSILNSTYFPPADMWYAALPINYYYFGHMVTAVLTRLSGLDLAVTFNLMLATIFALTLTMSLSVGVQLLQIGGIRGIRAIGGGIVTSFLVTLAGNMQTIYAFTRGYTGENMKPFWELFWGMGDIGGIEGIRAIGSIIWIGGMIVGLFGKIGEGMNTYWYPNATRFIPYTIHEFPSYSFVVSDVHGHVLSIPFVLLAIAMLIRLFIQSFEGRDALIKSIGRPNRIFLQESLAFVPYIFYGFLVGVLLMTNALDGPIYFALLGAVLGVKSLKSKVKSWKMLGVSMVVVLFIALLTSLPFLIHFKSFVTGVAVNCPPSFLANMKFGPILFEGVEKCQRSPLWMWWLLWGFFVYCGGGLMGRWIGGIRGISGIGDIWSNKITQTEKLLLIFFVFALALVIVPEVIYFKDIYPAHFRSNTMFKLGYEAFVLFSIVAGYVIVRAIGGLRGSGEIGGIREKNGSVIFLLILIPQLILVSIYPIFSVRSYFNGLKRYEGIDGLGWLKREYPEDWEAIKWLQGQGSSIKYIGKNTKEFSLNTKYSDLTPIIVEADGDSYTDYARFSVFTGRPTVIGWAVHEWLWRGTYDTVAPRREDVRLIYESEDLGETSALLNKYRVNYVVVGKLEREKYKNLQEWKFTQNDSNGVGLIGLGQEVFRSGGTVIYVIDSRQILPG